MNKEIDDGLCAYLCSTKRNFCLARKGYNPKTCPIKKAQKKEVKSEQVRQ